MPLPKWMKKVIGTETVGTASAQLWGKVQDGVAEEAVLVARNIGADSIDWYRRNLYTRMEMDDVNFNGGSTVLKAIQSAVLSRVGKALRGEQPKTVDANTRAKAEIHDRISKNGDSYLVYASTVGAALQTDRKVFSGQVQELAAKFGLDGEGLDFEGALSKHVTDWPWGHYFTTGRWRKEITPHLVRTAYLDVLGKLQQRYCEQAQNGENLHGELQTLADELGVIFERYSAYLAENTHYMIKPLRMEGMDDKTRDEQERLASFEGENLSAEERQAIVDAYQNTKPLITRAELNRQIADRIKNVPLPQNLLNYGKAYQPTEELKPEEHHLKPVLDRAPEGTPLWLAKAGGYNTAGELGTSIKKEGTELADEAMELGAEGVKWVVKYNVSHYLRQPMVIGGKDFNKPNAVSRAGGWILDNALSLLVPTIKEAIYADGSLPGLMILSPEKVTVKLSDGEMDPKLLNDLGNLSGVRLKPNDLIQRMKQKIENWPYNDRFSANAWKERILPHVIRTCYRAQLQEICNRMADDFRSSPNKNRELLWHGMNNAAALLGQIYERYTTQLTEKGHLLAPLSEKDMTQQNDEYRKTHAALTGDRKKKLKAALDAQKPLLTRKEIDQILDERVKSVTPSRADRPDPMAQFERCLRMDSSDDPTYSMPKNVLQAVLYIRELNRTNERSGFFRRRIFNREYKRIQSQLETMKQKLWAEIEGKHQTGKVSRELFNKLLDLKKPIECIFRQGVLLGYEQKKYAPPTLAEQAADGIRNLKDAVARTAVTGTRYVRNAVHYGAGAVADGMSFAYNNRGLIARAAGETVAAGAGLAANAIVATGRYIYRNRADIRHGVGYFFGGIARGIASIFRRPNHVQAAEDLAEVLEQSSASEEENVLEEEIVKPKTGAEFEIKRETLGKIVVQFEGEAEEELFSLENSEEGRKAREEQEKEDALETGKNGQEVIPVQPEVVPVQPEVIPVQPELVPVQPEVIPKRQSSVSLGPDSIFGDDAVEVDRPKTGAEFEIKRETLGKIVVQFEGEAEEELFSLENSEEGRKAREEQEKEDALETGNNGQEVVPVQPEVIPVQPEVIPVQPEVVPKRQSSVSLGLDSIFGDDAVEVDRPKTGAEFEIKRETLGKIVVQFEGEAEEELFSLENSEEGRKAREEQEKEDALETGKNGQEVIPVQPELIPVQPEVVPERQDTVSNAAEQPNVTEMSAVEGEGQPNVSEETNSAPVNGSPENKVTEANAEQPEKLSEQNRPDGQQPVNDDMDADQSITNSHGGGPAENDGMDADQSITNSHGGGPAENDDPELEKPDSEEKFEDCIGDDSEDEFEDCISDDELEELEGHAGSGGLGTQETEEKPAHDTDPDNAEYVYSKDGERFTEIKVDPELQLEAAQSSVMNRIQKRIEALQEDILKNEDQDQVVDEMGSLMEYMTLVSSIQELKVSKDGKVTCSTPKLNGKTPEQVARYLDGFLSERGKAAEKESASAFGQDPVFRSILQKNGGDIVKNARSMVESGNLVRTYQNYLQQKNAHAHTEKANADSAPAKKNGKNLNSSL